MQLHTLQPKTSQKKKKRIGRGGKRGSFSGRGIKGQKARSGRRIRPEIRDLIKKIPKRRGYRHTGPKRAHAAIRASLIAKKFRSGEVVSPKTLVARGLIRKVKGVVPEVKILEAGDFLKALVVKGCDVSQKFS